jgi:small-conductance mechanosensitive channel
VNVTALVAGLGIGGVAVALAVQNVLGDLLAALLIVLDKPFVIGDVIAVDQFVGSVEHIGLKSTRLRSLSGEQIVMTNGDLTKSRIRNYRRMFERRVVFTLGVVHRTRHDQLARIPPLIREVVTAQRYTRFDRSHFVGPVGSALTFEAVYFVTQPDYNLYMDIQQAIHLEIFRRLGEEQIELA